MYLFQNENYCLHGLSKNSLFQVQSQNKLKIYMIKKEKVNNENGYLLTLESWKIEFYLDKGKEKFI